MDLSLPVPVDTLAQLETFDRCYRLAYKSALIVGICGSFVEHEH